MGIATSIHSYRCKTNSCGKSTFVKRLWECKEHLSDFVFINIMYCYSENIAPHHSNCIWFVKGVPAYENPENMPTIVLLNDLIGSAYSTKVSKLFNKESHHRNTSLVLITQLILPRTFSSDISMNSKYIIVFKNPRGKAQIVQLARHVYSENISNFHRTYLEAYK